MKKDTATDFRYNTGDNKVPWAAVGENYGADDVLDVVKFLLQGQGAAYEAAVNDVEKAVRALSRLGKAPGKLSLAGKVAELEEKVDAYLGTRGSTFVTNATAGFEIAFRYANLAPGDEVIVPSITFIATMAYPLSVGAKVVFADVDPVTLNMDPADVARKVTKRTKVVVPVHIGGYPVDMDPLMELARKHDFLVLEDAAHGFGGKYKGRALGTIGHFGSFSFHEVKNITSFGEGGILCSSVAGGDLMKKARFLGVDTQKKLPDWFYDVAALPGKYGPFVANNSSTTEIQALGLIRQLTRYGGILKERRENARYLNGLLSGCRGLRVQPMGEGGTEPTFHLYLLQVDPKEAGGTMLSLRKKLEKKGVTTIPHFAPLYKFEVIRQLGYDQARIAASCPVTESVYPDRFTHLPIYGLTREQLDYLAAAVKESLAEMGRGA